MPNKFNIDKRKIHLSNLIITNQVERKEALEILEEIPYPSQQALNDDIDYFLKKMQWSEKNLIEYMNRPEVKHEEYSNELELWNLAKKTHEFIFKNKGDL